jgi:hypothetical protein
MFSEAEKALSTSAEIDVQKEATNVIRQFSISSKPRQFSAYNDVALYLLATFHPSVAYFIAVEIDQQIAPVLGYPPIGQIVLAVEHSPTAAPDCVPKAVDFLTCALLNFSDIETARKAYTVYTVREIKEGVANALLSCDEQVGSYISGMTWKAMEIRIPDMPRPLTTRERVTNWLFVFLQTFSRFLLPLLAAIGGFLLGAWLGALGGAFVGIILGFWMRYSMGLRGRDSNEGFLIRMKERAEGSRPGLFERLLESCRGNAFTQEKCRLITDAWEEAKCKMATCKSLDERIKIIQEVDRKVKAISYGQ